MKIKVTKLITAVIFAIVCTILLIVTAEAESRYIENKFVFGSYAPVVIIHHPLYNRVLEVKPDGSLSWANPNGSNSQIFVVLPTEHNGYYTFREFSNGGYTQRYITYTSKGFRMEAPGTDKYGMEVVKDTQMFKWTWKSSTTCAGKTVKKVWRLPCRLNNISMCFGGWGCMKIEQVNY